MVKLVLAQGVTPGMRLWLEEWKVDGFLALDCRQLLRPPLKIHVAGIAQLFLCHLPDGDALLQSIYPAT